MAMVQDDLLPHLELNEHYTKRKEEHLSRLRLAIPEYKAHQLSFSCWTDYSELVCYLMDNKTIREYDTDILALLVMYNKEWYFMKYSSCDIHNTDWEYILQLIVDVSPRPYLFISYCSTSHVFKVKKEFYENIVQQLIDKKEELKVIRNNNTHNTWDTCMTVDEWLSGLNKWISKYDPVNPVELKVN